jgi:hypothetical protein
MSWYDNGLAVVGDQSSENVSEDEAAASRRASALSFHQLFRETVPELRVCDDWEEPNIHIVLSGHGITETSKKLKAQQEKECHE